MVPARFAAFLHPGRLFRELVGTTAKPVRGERVFNPTCGLGFIGEMAKSSSSTWGAQAIDPVWGGSVGERVRRGWAFDGSPAKGRAGEGTLLAGPGWRRRCLARLRCRRLSRGRGASRDDNCGRAGGVCGRSGFFPSRGKGPRGGSRMWRACPGGVGDGDLGAERGEVRRRARPGGGRAAERRDFVRRPGGRGGFRPGGGWRDRRRG